MIGAVLYPLPPSKICKLDATILPKLSIDAVGVILAPEGLMNLILGAVR